MAKTTAPADKPKTALDRLNEAQAAKATGLIRVFAVDVVKAYQDSTNDEAKALYAGALKGLQDFHRSNSSLPATDLKDALANYMVLQLAEKHRLAIGETALQPAANAPADTIDYAAMSAAKERLAEKPGLSVDDVMNLPTGS